MSQCRCSAPVTDNVAGGMVPLGDVASNVSAPVVKAGVLTSEFWATLAVIATNVISCLVALHYVSATDAPTLTGQITGIIAALQMFIGNLVPLYQFISSRTQVKTAAMAAHTSRLNCALKMHIESARLEVQRLQFADPLLSAGQQAKAAAPRQAY